MFQSTHPHGVRLGSGCYFNLFAVFQSTHPHGVRLCWSLGYKCSLRVSIHAPTRGATLPLCLAGSKAWFQSTHPHGVRLQTLPSGASSSMFQSTHPHGVRPSLSQRPKPSCWFQSTHPHGVRPTAQGADNTDHGFNPRTHTGCDPGI